MPTDKQEKIFKQWLDEYELLILKVVRTYADLPQDRDDLFQEISLQIWSSIPGFQGNAKETTWIYRVALNTALVWRRTEKRKRRKFRAEFLNIREIFQAKDECDKAFQNQNVLDQVYDSIRQLSKSESSIVLLYLDGLSYDEIADVLGISKSNVGVRLNRAKKKLAQLLKGLIDDF